jgi:hypothetical protein
MLRWGKKPDFTPIAIKIVIGTTLDKRGAG